MTTAAHRPRPRGKSHDGYCAECYYQWPCPTLLAVDNGLGQANEAVAETYDAEGQRLWWHRPHAWLGRRVPSEMWLDGTDEDRTKVHMLALSLTGMVAT